MVLVVMSTQPLIHDSKIELGLKETMDTWFINDVYMPWVESLRTLPVVRGQSKMLRFMVRRWNVTLIITTSV